MNTGIKKTQFLWICVLYPLFTCCCSLVPARLPLNENAPVFLQFIQVSYWVSYLLCSLLCSLDTSWARPPGHGSFQVELMLLSWSVHICWVAIRAKKIYDVECGWWNLLDEALICASLLYTTVYAYADFSFEALLLWQNMLKLANNFSSYGEVYCEAYREKDRQVSFWLPWEA